jgi:nucleoside-diphosphate-sugar epimerase/CBS domain-containing protein
MVKDPSKLIVDSSASLRETMETIDRTGQGIAFVVNDDQVTGVVTDGDIRKGILEGVGLDTSIETICNEDPIVIYDSWDKKRRNRELEARDITSKVSKHGTLVLPVLNEDGQVIGIEYVSEDGELLSRSEAPARNVNQVLVIGGAGYVGSALCRVLLDRGYQVRVLDNAVYGTHGIDSLRENEQFTFIEGDMRSIEAVTDAITGVDAVIHLGALVGDPASGINPQKTLEMNYHSTYMIASICKYHQINRFIFASTCSVYGRSHDSETLLDEEDELNPVSLYAKTKIESEQALLDMSDGNFSPSIFRMATIYGLSQRMRFDLVVNILNAKAHFEDVVPIFGGKQYRPNVHVRDAAKAYAAALEAPIKDVGGEVFNVGSNEQNYKIEEIGKKISEVYPDSDIDWHREKEDERSYQVDFTKIYETLEYEVEETIESASREIKEALEAGGFEDYTDEKYSNYKTLEDDPLLEV